MFKRFRAWFIQRVIDPLRPYYPAIKVLEVFGVIAALIAFAYDFAVEKPRDRAIANATMYAQVASLDPEARNYHSAMQTMTLTLLTGGVPLVGLDLPSLLVKRVDLEDVYITQTRLKNSEFIYSNIDGGRFQYSDLEGTTFKDVTLNGLSFIGPHLTWRSNQEIKALADQGRGNWLDEIQALPRSNFGETTFEWVVFDDVKVKSLDFTGATFDASVFRKTSFETSLFAGTGFWSSAHRKDQSWDVLFRSSYFKGADFSTLTSEEMQQIRFIGCIFEDTKFPDGYVLSDKNAIIR